MNDKDNPIEVYDVDKLVPGHMAVMMSDNASDDNGMPFWIGKVGKETVKPGKPHKNFTDYASDDSDGEKTGEHVRVTEYSSKAPAVSTKRTYQPVCVQPRPGSRSKASEARCWTSTNYILFTFDKLTKGNTIDKKTLQWIYFKACLFRRNAEKHLSNFNPRDEFYDTAMAKYVAENSIRYKWHLQWDR